MSAVVYINLRFGLSTNKCVVYAEVSEYHRIMRLFESAAEMLGEVMKICLFIYLIYFKLSCEGDSECDFVS